MTRRNGGLTVPVILIAIGVIFLLINTGTVSAAALQRLGDLWPLLLVIVGLQFVFNHSLPHRQARFAGLGAAAVIAIAALAYAVLSPLPASSNQSEQASEAIGALTSASLDLSYSRASIDLRSGTLNNELFNAEVDYPGGEQPPDIALDREAARLDVSGGSAPFSLFRTRGTRQIVMNLTTRIPWTVRLSGGAARLNLQLAEVPLARLDISGGTSRVDLSLPHPKGDLPVSLSGGSSALTIRAPSGTEWRLSVDGGVSSADLNGVHLAGSSNLRQQSSGYASASNRLTIEISGGVSHLNLGTG